MQICTKRQNYNLSLDLQNHFNKTPNPENAFLFVKLKPLPTRSDFKRRLSLQDLYIFKQKADGKKGIPEYQLGDVV